MVGVHVHHNPRRCDGGRNIPEHLYVYSVENHDYVHGGSGFVAVATEGGKRTVELGVGIHNPGNKGMFGENGRRNGREAKERGKGIFDPANEEKVRERRAENGRNNGERNGKKCSKKVRCVETGSMYLSTQEAGRETKTDPGGIARSARSGGRIAAGGHHWVYLDRQESK
jgi:hypothetical protein